MKRLRMLSVWRCEVGAALSVKIAAITHSPVVVLVVDDKKHLAVLLVEDDPLRRHGARHVGGRRAGSGRRLRQDAARHALDARQRRKTGRVLASDAAARPRTCSSDGQSQ